MRFRYRLRWNPFGREIVLSRPGGLPLEHKKIHQELEQAATGATGNEDRVAVRFKGHDWAAIRLLGARPAPRGYDVVGPPARHDAVARGRR